MTDTATVRATLHALHPPHPLLTALAHMTSTSDRTPQSDMDIHGARPDDLTAIKRLLSTLDLPHSDLTRSHLEHFLVCRDGTDGDAPVGVVGLELYGAVALLRSLAVRPSHRGRGIGARLTERIEDYGRTNGVEELYLLTTTAADYFDRRSYETVERDELPTVIEETDEAAQLCPASATCMRKVLPARDR